MNIIEVSNLKKEYKYKVKDKGRGFLYNLFNEKTKSLSAVNDISLSIKKEKQLHLLDLMVLVSLRLLKCLQGYYIQQKEI